MIKKAEIVLEICLLCLTVWLALHLIRKTDLSEDEMYEAGGQTEILQETAQALPRYYDARNERGAFTVKDQGSLGTCWALAASSALEAYFMPQERLVFSADHLSLQNHFAKEQNDGGDYTMVMAYLAGWQGPVLEADDPYGDGESADTLMPVKHVQEMQMFKEKNYEAIKEAIRRYGSVQSSLYMDLQNAFSASVYYNQIEHSYYYDGKEKANHDILIIGWDDDYPASKFNRNTSRNGAFICQNSWGEKFGDRGIFYVSYEDVNIGKNGIAYAGIEGTDNFDHLYQTDLCGWVGQLGYGDGVCYFANVYEASGVQSLEAVGFYATERNTRYRIYVVEDFRDESSLYMHGSGQSGRMEEAGYYTVPLEQPVFLEAGQNYAVVVEIDTPGTQYPVATEYAADDATKTVDISDGRGYISHDGILWKCVEKEHQANVCLKAYTNDR